ncbi:MAG: metalloregulator ArsR/SmtB family transcription factor [Halieaceae bacterium]|nr:metalloregulator ArsR/SmtB family transcription factor [Halieaceae bacterium]
MLAPAMNEQPDALATESLDSLVSLCKASADSLRLQVLRVLRGDSFGVSELCELFAIRQPALSHHLKVLAAAGLVATRREGNSIFYSRAELGQRPELQGLQDSLFIAVDAIVLPDELVNRMAALQQRRAANSQDFFRNNADKFREQQDLIASYEQYADTVAQVIQDAPLAKRESVLEVGPGDGAFLDVLSPGFARVIALDNAAAMLETARARANDRGLTNVRFIHGDTGHSDLQAVKADCIVANMVLHHTPDPAAVLRDIAGCLNPGGVVVITDLCSHDQAWARENCGDLWLGFEPEDLAKWAARVGLTDIASVYLAQRNGFKVQVRLFGHQ